MGQGYSLVDRSSDKSKVSDESAKSTPTPPIPGETFEREVISGPSKDSGDLQQATADFSTVTVTNNKSLSFSGDDRLNSGVADIIDLGEHICKSSSSPSRNSSRSCIELGSSLRRTQSTSAVRHGSLKTSYNDENRREKNALFHSKHISLRKANEDFNFLTTDSARRSNKFRRYNQTNTLPSQCSDESSIKSTISSISSLSLSQQEVIRETDNSDSISHQFGSSKILQRSTSLEKHVEQFHLHSANSTKRIFIERQTSFSGDCRVSTSLTPTYPDEDGRGWKHLQTSDERLFRSTSFINRQTFTPEMQFTGSVCTVNTTTVSHNNQQSTNTTTTTTSVVSTYQTTCSVDVGCPFKLTKEEVCEMTPAWAFGTIIKHSGHLRTEMDGAINSSVEEVNQTNKSGYKSSPLINSHRANHAVGGHSHQGSVVSNTQSSVSEINTDQSLSELTNSRSDISTYRRKFVGNNRKTKIAGGPGINERSTLVKTRETGETLERNPKWTSLSDMSSVSSDMDQTLTDCNGYHREFRSRSSPGHSVRRQASSPDHSIRPLADSSESEYVVSGKRTIRKTLEKLLKRELVRAGGRRNEGSYQQVALNDKGRRREEERPKRGEFIRQNRAASPNHWIPSSEHSITASAIVHRAESDSEVDLLNEVISHEESKILKDTDANHSPSEHRNIAGDDLNQTLTAPALPSEAESKVRVESKIGAESSERSRDDMEQLTRGVSQTSLEQGHPAVTGGTIVMSKGTGESINRKEYGFKTRSSELGQVKGGRGPSPLPKPMRGIVKEESENRQRFRNVSSSKQSIEEEEKPVRVRSDGSDMDTSDTRQSPNVLIALKSPSRPSTPLRSSPAIHYTDSFASVNSKNSSNKPVAMVQPRKVHGVKVLPSSATPDARTILVHSPQSPHLIDRSSRQVSRSPALRSANRQSGAVNRQSGPINRQSGPVKQKLGPVSRQSDSINRQSGSVNRQSVPIDRQSGPIAHNNNIVQLNDVDRFERSKSSGACETGSTRDRVNKLLEKCAKQQSGPGRVLDKVHRIESEESHYARLVRQQQRKLLRSIHQKQLQMQQTQQLRQHKRESRTSTINNEKIRPRSKSEDNWECKPYKSNQSPVNATRIRTYVGVHRGRSGAPMTHEGGEEEGSCSPVDSLNANEKLLLSRKKDAEIAALLHHLRLDAASPERSIDGQGGSDDVNSEQSCNFERSLGYFP